MVETAEHVQTNPCNNCVHRDCCKYVEDIQKVIKEMDLNLTRQVLTNEKVFELSTRVIFKCPTYLEDKNLVKTLLRTMGD